MAIKQGSVRTTCLHPVIKMGAQRHLSSTGTVTAAMEGLDLCRGPSYPAIKLLLK